MVFSSKQVFSITGFFSQIRTDFGTNLVYFRREAPKQFLEGIFLHIFDQYRREAPKKICEGVYFQEFSRKSGLRTRFFFIFSRFGEAGFFSRFFSKIENEKPFFFYMHVLGRNQLCTVQRPCNLRMEFRHVQYTCRISPLGNSRTYSTGCTSGSRGNASKISLGLGGYFGRGGVLNAGDTCPWLVHARVANIHTYRRLRLPTSDFWPR